MLRGGKATQAEYIQVRPIQSTGYVSRHPLLCWSSLLASAVVVLLSAVVPFFICDTRRLYSFVAGPFISRRLPADFFPRPMVLVSTFQVGKGRDVGLGQITGFVAKISMGNGMQARSREASHWLTRPCLVLAAGRK